MICNSKAPIDFRETGENLFLLEQTKAVRFPFLQMRGHQTSFLLEMRLADAKSLHEILHSGFPKNSASCEDFLKRALNFSAFQKFATGKNGLVDIPRAHRSSKDSCIFRPCREGSKKRNSSRKREHRQLHAATSHRAGQPFFEKKED